MKRMSTRVAVTALGLPLVVAAAAATWIACGPQQPADRTAQRLSAGERAKLGGLAIPFIRNQGQLDADVAYYAPTFAGTAFVTREGDLVLSLPPRSGKGASAGGWTLVEAPSTDRRPQVRGVQPSPTRVSVFQGASRADWRHGLPTYAQVSLGAVWPGVDYSVRAHGDNVERIFTVQPGARADAIRMQVRGARALKLDGGRLVAVTGRGAVALSRPRAWQMIDHRRRPVPVRYTVNGDQYGFSLGAHERGRAVVIDPLIRETYLGGSGGTTTSTAMQVAPNGNIYLTGTTTSAAFPGTVGGAQPALAGAHDAYVAELNPNLSQLLQATYLGGSNDDFAAALAIAPSGTPMAGDVYVAGTTRSSDFPGTSGGAQAQCGSGASNCTDNGDAFVSVLSANLQSLVQSSYLGGSGIDEGHALVIAPGSATSAGAVYVGGRTLSSDFPHVSGGAQPQPASGDFEGFVVRLDPGLTLVTQASYLGGSGVDEIYALAMAPAPSTATTVYAGGDTSSSDFPCTGAGGPAPAGGACASTAQAGAQGSLAGGFDAFVSQLNGGLTQIDQSTYLGGTDVDSAYTLAVAPASSSQAGQVFVGGLTYSSDLPATASAAQPAEAGDSDGFLARMSANLRTLGQSTYVGGGSGDSVRALAFSGSDVYAVGATASNDFPCAGAEGLPTPAGSGTTCTQQNAGAGYEFAGGSTDGFVALMNANLKGFAQASYVGGKGNDELSGVALAPAPGSFAGDVLMSGSTTSADLSATAGAAQPASTGSGTAFAAAITPDLKGSQVTLSMNLTAPDSVLNKNPVTMQIVVTNESTDSTAQATNVKFFETITTSSSTGKLDYVSATSTQGSCSDDNGFVTCNLGTLAPNGGNATITIKAKATTVGDVDSLLSLHADQALLNTPSINLSHTTTVKKNKSSGGGGAFGWPSLLLLGLLGTGLALRRRETAG